MKKLTMIVTVAMLSGCGTNTSHQIQRETVPGAALPAGIAVCLERDGYGRCKEWSSKSHLCNNPEGYGDPILCTQLKAPPKPKYEF